MKSVEKAVLLAAATIAPLVGSFAAPTVADAQPRPSASTCDIARRQGRTIPGCARRPVQRTPTPTVSRPPRPRATAAARLIRPGRHQCQVSAGYAFRPCTVTALGSGRYELVIPNGLLGLRGQLEERGGALHFQGNLTEDVPFICNGDRSVPDYRETLERCRNQPIAFVLRRGRNGWAGDVPNLVQVQTQYVGARPPERRPVSHELVPYETLPLAILH